MQAVLLMITQRKMKLMMMTLTYTVFCKSTNTCDFCCLKYYILYQFIIAMFTIRRKKFWSHLILMTRRVLHGKKSVCL